MYRLNRVSPPSNTASEKGQSGAKPAAAAVLLGVPAREAVAATPDPCTVQCPFCHALGVTVTKKVATGQTCRRACSLTLSCCCFCLPCLWGSLKDIRHYCSNCKQLIGECPAPEQ